MTIQYSNLEIIDVMNSYRFENVTDRVYASDIIL